MSRGAGRVALSAAALAAAAIVAMATSQPAGAGTYRAVQCHRPIGAGHADAAFSATSRHYLSSVDCAARGLGVEHQPGAEPTGAGRFGAWTLTAPSATELVGAAARVGADGDDGHLPQLLIATADGARRVVAGVRGAPHPVSWAGAGGRALVARLICSRRRRCGPGAAAHLHVGRISLTLRDSTAPSLTPGGSLLAPGPRRGRQALAVAVRDLGSGARTITVELNDDPLAARVLDCALAERVAVRLRPCPASATAGFEFATASRHFRQGPNVLHVCAADYAPRGGVNRACATRTVRIDNLCPVSTVPGALLRARFRGAGTRLITRSDRSAVVVGTVTDAAGAPVPGARVCVASRTRRGEPAERVVATPTTDASGAFRARLPAGPSRGVRVAHWAGAERALERHLVLRARAIPRLRLRPDRTLANGDRLRFAVRIPRPARQGRRVLVQARADRRWIPIAGGRTSSTGRWRGGYRFRSTTATRRYAFRAVVPRQPGYPYVRGHSRIRRATVAG